MNPATPKLSITDADLLNSITGDDKELAHQALNSLVERYERLVWSVCRRQLKNYCDIEDAFQTTFLQLASSAKQIRNPESLSSWLFGVALRTSSRIRRRQQFDNNIQPLDSETVLVANDEPPLDRLTRQHQIDSVNRQLMLLDDKYRTPLILFYFGSLTTREIAHRLGLSRTALEGRLRRGRSRLRSQLASDGIGWSPAIFAIGMFTNSLERQSQLATGFESWITAIPKTATVVSTKSGILSTGTKLMICKLAVSTGLASLLAIGAWMHTPAQKESNSEVVLTVKQEADDSQATLNDTQEPPTTLEELHTHLHEVHNDVFAHIHKFMDSFSIFDEEEIDIEDSEGR